VRRRSDPNIQTIPIKSDLGKQIRDQVAPNPWMENARKDRALKLSTALRSAGIRSGQVGEITEEYWMKLAGALGLNYPISDETKKLVVNNLQVAESFDPQS